MGSVERVSEIVGERPFMSVERAHVITRLIHALGARDVLELGFYEGVSTCYIAAALDADGSDGHLTSIDLASRLRDGRASVEDLLGKLGLLDRVTIFYEYSSYNWRLGRLLAREPRPEFDLVYIDGAHTWDTDGFAFLLVEQLLAPGGVIVFSDLQWSFAKSRWASGWSELMPAEQREPAQVRLVCDVLVAPHPRIARCWDDGQWAYARKIGTPDRALDRRDAAREALRGDAEELRRRAVAELAAGRWSYGSGATKLYPVPPSAEGARPGAARWDARYVGEAPPWDIGAPQPALVELAELGQLAGKLIDVGCGSGEHTILAAQHGADAIGVDISPVAVAIARTKAAERSVSSRFVVNSALSLDELGETFNVAIDSGFFPSLDENEHERYLAGLARVVDPGGVLYLTCLSDKEPGDWGPRRLSREQIEAAFANGWSVEDIVPCKRRTNHPEAPTGEAEAWLATIRRAQAVAPRGRKRASARTSRSR